MIRPVVAIVVTYNRKDLLMSCINRLLKQQGASCDVLIIDNASTDGTADAVAPLLNEQVRCLRNDSNVGGAGGFHAGIKKAFELGYQYFWLMDDDTLPYPDALSKLIEADQVLGGSYGYLSSAALWTDGSECRMNRQKIKKAIYERIELLKYGLVQIEQATFVSFLIRAETVRKFGLPIKEFFIWGDDIEYSRRIAVRGGCPGYLAGQSQVVHAMKDNTGSNIAKDGIERIDRYRYAFRNEFYLYRQEGLRGILYYLAKCARDFLRITFHARKHRGKRYAVLLSAMWKGLWFHPKAEYMPQNSETDSPRPVLVYYSNYDWQMIKQRQQFLCEALGRYYSVHAVFQHRYRRRILQQGRQTTGVQLHPIYLFPPLGWRFSLINAVNTALRKRALKRILRRTGADILVLSHPEQGDLIPADYRNRVVYDCMDDNIVAPPDGKELLRAEQEARLCRKADVIWASSLHIQRMLQEKYAFIQPPLLVRNAYDSELLDAKTPVKRKLPGERFRICYFGMIAEWFDFPLLVSSLDRFQNIEYHLIGPVSQTYCAIYRHPRIVYHGTVEHAALPAYVKDMDCFIMPFIRSNLIEAVDPVKIYEYIGFQRNILCVDYPEIRRFDPFIRTYTDTDDYCAALERLMEDNRLTYSPADAETFLRENTWERRAEAIHAHMHGQIQRDAE